MRRSKLGEGMKNKSLSKNDFPDDFHEDFRPAITKCRCPKCRSGNLLLVERVTAYTEWTVINGKLNRAEGIHEPTGADGVDGKCRDCGHSWRIRNAIQITCVAIELDPETFEPI